VLLDSESLRNPQLCILPNVNGSVAGTNTAEEKERRSEYKVSVYEQKVPVICRKREAAELTSIFRES